MQSFYFSVYLASVRKKGIQNFLVKKNFLIQSKVWTGCVVRQKMRSNTKTNHTQNKTMRTKGVFLENWFEKMVLKDNGYIREESYLYSRQYSLLSALLDKWVSLAIKDWQCLTNFLKDNRKQKLCRLTPWSKLHRRKLWKKLRVSRENAATCNRKKCQLVFFSMQRTKPKYSFQKLQAEIVGWEHVRGKILVILRKQFWKRGSTKHNWTSWLFRPPKISLKRTKERKQKTAKSDSNCGSTNSETKRGSAAKNYQGLWTSNSRRVKRLCSLWTFHSILFHLEGTVLKYIIWNYFFNWRENLNSMCGYAQRQGETQKNYYAK